MAFLRRILDAAVTGLEGANADFEHRGVDTWPLFDLEDLLAQCWLPDSWLRARVSGALDELARETGESRAALEVRARPRRWHLCERGGVRARRRLAAACSIACVHASCSAIRMQTALTAQPPD